jgi:TonB-dependent starch-binding outer membrane protein SusC
MKKLQLNTVSFSEGRQKKLLSAIKFSLLLVLFSYSLSALGYPPTLSSSIKVKTVREANSDERTIIQALTVKGMITDSASGERLIGVSVYIKGTTTGTTTDADGNYSISVPDPSAVLVFSYVGYRKRESPVAGNTTINVALSAEFTKVEEVVVVGYGVQRRSVVTGAITSVKSEDIQNTNIQRPEQALQGKTSGVQVVPQSGAPGAGMNIRIRGYSSNGNSNPIFIVDGTRTGDINYLDPNDIASMDVLKDAASAAIYGAEGGNGVVLITTKQGQAGKMQVTYDFQQAWQSVRTLPTLMNTSQYKQYMNEKNGAGNAITNATIDTTYNTDWLKEIFKTGYLTKHYLSFSGGNEKSTYLVGLSYLRNDGIIVGNQDVFERYTARLNADHQVNNWLKVGNNLDYSHFTTRGINENGGEFGGVIGSALQLDPTTPVEYTDPSKIPAAIQAVLKAHPNALKAPDGNYWGISQYVAGEIVNPFVTQALTNGIFTQDKLQGNVYVDIKPVKTVTFTSRLGLESTFTNNHFWNPTYYYDDIRTNSSTLITDQDNRYLNWTWENFATYNQKFGEHNLTLLAGMSAQDNIHNDVNASGGPMVVEQPQFAYLDYIATQPGVDHINGTKVETRLQSYFGRVAYDYSSKYLLQASLRRDGAGLSQVPKSGRWGLFPAFSAGWVMTNEDFFPKGGLSYAKIRGSWGQNGSLSILGGNYAYASLIGATNGGQTLTYPISTGTSVTVFEPRQTANPSLTWETSQQADVGLDLRAFADRLSFTVDYFDKKTKDLILTNIPPAEAGNNSAPINGGDVENKGFEFELGYKNVAGDLSYGIDLNLSTLKNNVTYINPLVGTRAIGAAVGTGWNATLFQKGEPIWYFYGYKTHGIDKNTGDPIFVTAAGKDTTAAGVSQNDQQFIGSSIPKLTFGGTINLAYKGIDFTASFNGSQGNKVLLGWIRTDKLQENRPIYFYNGRWTTPGVAASKPAANADAKTWQSDQVVFDGSFLRIQTIQLGYTIPANIIKMASMNKIRIYLSLDNFFTITHYPGMDPQATVQGTNGNSGNPNSFGIDRGTYPQAKDIMLGATVSF